jgi:hypothetical protein
MNNIQQIQSWLKAGNVFWCEGKMKNIYDIAKEKNLTELKALEWSVCYYIDHN